MQKVQLRDKVIFSFSFAIATRGATYTCPTQDRLYYKYYISAVDGQTGYAWYTSSSAPIVRIEYK